MKVSTELRNRNSVLSASREVYESGLDASIEAVMARVLNAPIWPAQHPDDEAYEALMTAEWEQFGSFGGKY